MKIESSSSQNTSSTLSRDHESLSLATYFETQGYTVGRPTFPCVTPDEKKVLFLQSKLPHRDLRLYEFDIATKTTTELLSAEQLLLGQEEQLSQEERARRERLRLTARGFTSFSLSQEGRFILLPLSGRVFLFDRNTLAVSEVPQNGTAMLDACFSPDDQFIAYVSERNLWVFDRTTQKKTQLTHSTDSNIHYGLAEFVAQEEMQRFAGFFFSPESTHIAVCEVNENGVEEFHILDPAHPEVIPQVFPYPRPGHSNAVVRLGIVAVQGGPIVWIKWDQEQFPYLATVRWQKNSPLTLVVQTRNQKCLQILTANPQTGITTVLLEEHDPAWINLDQTVPHWLRDGSGFLWSSEQRGGPELQYHSRDGKMLSVLVPKEMGYQDLLFVDEEEKNVIVGASQNSTERHLFRISLHNSKADRLVQTRGIHHGRFGNKGTLWIHTHTDLTSLSRTTLRNQDGQVLAELTNQGIEPSRLADVELCQVGPQEFQVALIRPQNFDPGLQYPVIVDVYAGPCHNHVLQNSRQFLLSQWLADQGFIVVAIDGRGTPGRGRDWERALQGNFGHIPLEDQVTALQILFTKYPELDPAQVGICGWSFGGYMAALAVLRRPDVFHAGFAGAPVVDWRDYDTHYTERYLGLPSENPAGYDQSSLLTYANQLSRPLLLMHGTADDNVYFFHSLKLSKALFNAGKAHEFLPLIGASHMVSDPVQNQRKWELIVTFFKRELKKMEERR